jgi:hypothetical protein
VTLRGGLAGSPFAFSGDAHVDRGIIYPRARSSGAKQMVRKDLIALGAGCFMFTGGVGFSSFIAPEPAEVRLARIRGGVDYTMSVRTLPPDVKALRCMMMWVGGPGG